MSMGMLEIGVVRGRDLCAEQQRADFVVWAKFGEQEFNTTSTAGPNATWDETLSFICQESQNQETLRLEVRRDGQPFDETTDGYVQFSLVDASSLQPNWFPVRKENGDVVGELFLAISYALTQVGSSMGHSRKSKINQLRHASRKPSVVGASLGTILPQIMMLAEEEMDFGDVQKLLACDPTVVWPSASLCAAYPLLDCDPLLSYSALARRLDITLSSNRPPPMHPIIQGVYADLLQRLEDVHFGSGAGELQMCDFETDTQYWEWRETEKDELRQLLKRLVVDADFPGSRLSVFIHYAHDLPKIKPTMHPKTCDPYVKVVNEQPGQPRIKVKSRVIPRSRNATFEEELMVPLYTVSDKITLSVWDYEKKAKKIQMGKVSIDCLEFADGMSQTKEWTLEHPKTGKKKRKNGKPKAGTVTATVQMFLSSDITAKVHSGPSDMDREQCVDILIKAFLLYQMNRKPDVGDDNGEDATTMIFGQISDAEWGLLEEYAMRYGVGLTRLHLRFVGILARCLGTMELDKQLVADRLQQLLDILDTKEAQLSKRDFSLLRNIADIFQRHAVECLSNLSLWRSQCGPLLTLLQWSCEYKALGQTNVVAADEMFRLMRAAVQESYLMIERGTACSDDEVLGTHDAEAIVLLCESVADAADEDYAALVAVARDDLAKLALEEYSRMLMTSLKEYCSKWQPVTDDAAEFTLSLCSAMNRLGDLCDANGIDVSERETLPEALSPLVVQYIKEIPKANLIEWVAEALATEKWHAVGEFALHSESVLDIFNMMYAAMGDIQSLRLLDETALYEVVDVLCITVEKYGHGVKNAGTEDNMVAHGAGGDGDADQWLLSETCVRLNNLQTARVHIEAMYEPLTEMYQNILGVDEIPEKASQRITEASSAMNTGLTFILHKTMVRFNHYVLEREMAKLMSKYPEDVNIRLDNFVDNLHLQIAKVNAETIVESLHRRVLREAWEVTVSCIQLTAMPMSDLLSKNAQPPEPLQPEQMEALVQLWSSEDLMLPFEGLSTTSLAKRLSVLRSLTHLAGQSSAEVEDAFSQMLASGASKKKKGSDAGKHTAVDLFRLTVAKMDPLEARVFIDNHGADVATTWARSEFGISKSDRVVDAWDCKNVNNYPGKLCLTTRQLCFTCVPLGTDENRVAIDLGSIVTVTRDDTTTGAVIVRHLKGGAGKLKEELAEQLAIAVTFCDLGDSDSLKSILHSIVLAARTLGHTISVKKEKKTLLHVLAVSVLGASIPENIGDGSLNPFAVVQLGTVLRRTKTIKYTFEPRWEETLYVPVYSMRQALSVQVFDGDIVHSKFLAKGEVLLKTAGYTRQRREFTVAMIGEGGISAGELTVALEVGTGEEAEKSIEEQADSSKRKKELAKLTALTEQGEAKIAAKTEDEVPVLRQIDPARLTRWVKMSMSGGELWAVKVHLHGCTNLIGCGGDCNPFVTLSLKSQKKSSSTVSDSINPSYDEHYRWDLVSQGPPTPLEVYVYHSKMFGLRSIPFGTAEIDLSALAGIADPPPQTVKLMQTDGEGSAGNITLQIIVEPPAGSK